MTKQQGETRLVTTTEVVVLNRGERSSSRYVICAMAWTLSVSRGNCAYFVDRFAILLPRVGRNPNSQSLIPRTHMCRYGRGMWVVAVPMIEFAAPVGDSPRCATVGVTERSRSCIGVWHGD